jgi:dimethylhistidine N-methyltransferase
VIETGRLEAEAQGSEGGDFLTDVLEGLSQRPKRSHPKWLYDARGSALYERITRLDAYYPTRTETGILERHAHDIARAIGPGAALFEYGSGSAAKTALVLAALDRPSAYVPVDISRSALLGAAERILRRFPALPVRPILADFTLPVPLPLGDLAATRRVAFFPGSTIGNFDPPDAVGLLRRMARDAGPGGRLLIGLDLRKDEATLVRAYDDEEGVTAAFDLNLLVRMNRELGADFELSRFRHRAVFDGRLSRVEMHLESLEPQLVHVSGHPFTFREGETIHTESSYKWEITGFDALAAIAGFAAERTWTDERAWFCVKLYRVER